MPVKNPEIVAQIAKRYGGNFSEETNELTISREVHVSGQRIDGIYVALLMTEGALDVEDNLMFAGVGASMFANVEMQGDTVTVSLG